MSTSHSSNSRSLVALVAVTGLTTITGCSRPMTDDLDRRDSGAAMDAAADAMDARATPDVVDVPDVPDDAPSDVPSDVNRCETGAGSEFDLCNGVCINIATDRNNCGMCGRRCAPDQACSEGGCVFACSAGLVACDNRCIDPRTNPDFCGARSDCLGAANRGATCTGGRTCVAGTCQFVCPAGQVACDGNCVDPAANPLFCGASGDCTGATRGTSCPSGQICTAMGCRCPSGFVSCGGTCIDPNTNRDNCGASGACTGATAGTRCPAGQICVGGTCGTTCGTGAVLCGGNCIEPLSNRQFCGARGDCAGANAGRVCSSTELCINGACTYFEPPESFASVQIEQPFEATVNSYRPLDVTLGAVRNGTIYYSCNGSVPMPGAGGTFAVLNNAIVAVGTPGACSRLRWYEDYGAPLGAERAVHERVVNVLPTPPQNITRDNLVDAVRINSRGPVALLAPGQSFTVDYNHQWWHSGPNGYCPGCIVQASVSMDSDNAEGLVSLECTLFGGGLYYPGQRVSRRVTLNAPMRPGRYAIRYRVSDEFSCRNGSLAWPGGAPVGLIIVN